MLILNRTEFKNSDLSNAKEFIESWNKYYEFDDRAYFENLNLRGNLTRRKIKKILIWKAPIYLRKFKKGRKMVRNVLKHIISINRFRDNKLYEEKFHDITENIFQSGIVWRALLFNIARPWDFPIADKNVFLAYSTLTGEKIPEEWNEYMKFRNFFFRLSKAAGIIRTIPKGNEREIHRIVFDLKKVYSALFAFGQFLERYDK